MKVFGFYNGGYWMMIFSVKEIIEQIGNTTFQANENYIRASLANGKYIWVNKVGGFHADDIENKKSFIASKYFPTSKQKIDYLNEKIDIINEERRIIIKETINSFSKDLQSKEPYYSGGKL